tara:strand:- start:235 stop:363 length:129 start_codon:yes stop_codon:yes gene_type:complete
MPLQERRTKKIAANEMPKDVEFEKKQNQEPKEDKKEPEEKGS